VSPESTSGKADWLLAEYEGRVRAFFRRRCHDPDQVDDLVQEVLCAMLGSYGRFMHRSSVSTWVFAICRNTFSNHEYRRRREERVRRALIETEAGESPQDTCQVRLALDGLSAGERLLYKLFYVEGWSVRRIALHLARPEGTVKYLLYRLRQHFRTILG
jgi:RNA polymerase sigma factor (sigma-70 family)